MTEKLYDCDAYLTEFDCKVTNLYIEGDALAVETDRTAFFPTGGGQLCDRGTLGGIDVENVELRGDRVLHFVENTEENVKKLQTGTVLHGKIDWNKRFSDMQQHTGEHILSGIVHRLFGMENAGFHLSASEVTVDFGGILTESDLCKVEDLVNETIWKNLSVRAWYPAEAELPTLTYRSKKEIDGPLRLVEIEGVDRCACCAPHVAKTGEIGAFRILKTQKNRGGIRLWILCGKRLMLDTREKLEQNRAVGRLLSCKETETAQHVKMMQAQAAALEYRMIGLQREQLAARANAMAAAPRLVAFACGSGDLLREFADLLSRKAEQFAAVFSEEAPHRFVVISQTGYDLDALCGAMCQALSARGGGRNGVLQGSIPKSREEIELFFAQTENF